MPKLLTGLLLLVLPGCMYGGNTCLWMNEATASGILGGAAKVETKEIAAGAAAGTANAKSSAGPVSANPDRAGYNGSGGDDQDCTFVHKEGAVVAEIYVGIRTEAQAERELSARMARCGGNRAVLRSLGNEAMACDTAEQTPGRAEEIVGRVRDRVFTVRVTSNDKAKSPTALRDEAKAAAEIVVGNLF